MLNMRMMAIITTTIVYSMMFLSTKSTISTKISVLSYYVMFKFVFIAIFTDGRTNDTDSGHIDGTMITSTM